MPLDIGALESAKQAVTDLGGNWSLVPQVATTSNSGTSSPQRLVGKRKPPTAMTTAPTAKPSVRPITGAGRQAKLAQLRGDKLGTYVQRHTRRYQEMEWREFVREMQGAGDLRVTEEALSSQMAGELLLQFEKNGVPTAISSAPLSPKTKELRVQRGPHKSCSDHFDFLREELLLDYVEKGFWILLPYRQIKDGFLDSVTLQTDRGPCRTQTVPNGSRSTTRTAPQNHSRLQF